MFFWAYPNAVVHTQTISEENETRTRLSPTQIIHYDTEQLYQEL